MSRSRFATVCVVVVGVGFSTAKATAVPLTIFKDNFQTDSPVLSDSTADADPLIDTPGGDIGGNWVCIESPALSVQLEYDTVPAQNGQNGSLVAGTNNYLRVYRGGGPSTRGGPFARGWTAADTNDRVMQLDLNMYQPTGSSMSIFFGTTNPGGITVSSGINNFANNSTVATSLDVADNQWVPVRIIANLSATTAQLGLDPQKYTVSIDGVTGSPASFTKAANQVTAILVGLSDTNETFNYVDDVQIQILNPIPPPVPGDYDGNGFVDDPDYVLWRKGVQPLPFNEVDTVGTTNDQDYVEWQTRFGNPTLGSGSGAGLGVSAVPEPAAAILLWACAGVCCLCRWRHN
jgi:hypothetical protein